jgi:hypothetical protein
MARRSFLRQLVALRITSELPVIKPKKLNRVCSRAVANAVVIKSGHNRHRMLRPNKTY